MEAVGTLRNQVLQENHDAVTAAHLGVDKTIARITQHYYWPGMHNETASYVRACTKCQTFKVSSQKTAGDMHPTPTSHPWEVISAYFMGPFPRSTHGKTMLLVINNKFTKWSEIIPVPAATTPAVMNALRYNISDGTGGQK